MEAADLAEDKVAAVQVGATIFFADKAGVRTDHHAVTTWAPVGRTRVVAATGKRKSVNVVSVVSPGGQIYFDVFEGSMNATRFVEFCAKLAHDCPPRRFGCRWQFRPHRQDCQKIRDLHRRRLSLFFYHLLARA